MVFFISCQKYILSVLDMAPVKGLNPSTLLWGLGRRLRNNHSIYLCFDVSYSWYNKILPTQSRDVSCLDKMSCTILHQSPCHPIP